MTESKLQAGLLELLRAELASETALQYASKPVIIKHSDGFTSGSPDISITWKKKDTWWELKHGEKVVWANALQQLTCRRLAANGICYVVLYEDVLSHRRTCILTPDEEDVEVVDGFDHRFVLDFVRRTHAQ